MPASEEEWGALVRAIVAGEQQALHELYARAHRIVFTLIVRITDDPQAAEQLTVDVFHDLWRNASRYDAADGTVLAWIMNVARAVAIAHRRSEPQQPTDPRASALSNALAVLTPDERQTIEAAFFSGLTHAEVAVRLNQSEGMVKALMRSALHKLQQAMAAEGKP